MHLIVYILVQYHTLIYTLEKFLCSQAKFQHVLVADTITIREDITDQKTLMLEGVYHVIHTTIFHVPPATESCLCQTCHVCTGVVGCSIRSGGPVKGCIHLC